MKTCPHENGDGNPELTASDLSLDPHFRGDDILYLYARKMIDSRRKSFEMSSYGCSLLKGFFSTTPIESRMVDGVTLFLPSFFERYIASSAAFIIFSLFLSS